MNTLILDAGALIAVDRNDRSMIARLRVALDSGMRLKTTGIVVAEAWHSETGRQANLARLLKAVDVKPVDEDLGREAGALLGKAGGGEPADATVVSVAASGDSVVTSDARDIQLLVQASGRSIFIVPC